MNSKHKNMNNKHNNMNNKHKDMINKHKNKIIFIIQILFLKPLINKNNLMKIKQKSLK